MSFLKDLQEQLKTLQREHDSLGHAICSIRNMIIQERTREEHSRHTKEKDDQDRRNSLYKAFNDHSNLLSIEKRTVLRKTTGRKQKK